MFVRVFQVTVREGQEAAFAGFFRETALPLVKNQPGLVSVTAGLPRPETPRAFCMVMVWQDVKSLRAFAGNNWREPHIHPDEAAMYRTEGCIIMSFFNQANAAPQRSPAPG